MTYGDDNSGGAGLMEAGPRQLQSAAQLPPDLMLLKMENDSIMSIARTVPRDPAKIVGQLADLINAYPAAAESAIYSKPVGSVIQVTCGSDRCGIKYEVNKVETDTVCPNCESKKRGECKSVKKFAEGLSIRAAEAIRSIYGYTRLTTTCELLKDGSAKLTGTLVDYAAGNMTSDERVVPRQYRAKSGQMVTIAEDRFLGVVVKAEKAKLIRDVVLANTPGIIKAMFRDMCEQKMLDLVSPELIEQKLIPAFEEYGITREHLDKIVGRPLKLGWKEADRLNLRKVLTALKNDETSVAELLSDLVVEQPKELPTAKPGPTTTAELTDKLKGKQQTQTSPTNQNATSTPEPEIDETGSLVDADAEFKILDAPMLVGKCEKEWLEKVTSDYAKGKIREFAAQARERLDPPKKSRK